jgi:hypothetical protein
MKREPHVEDPAIQMSIKRHPTKYTFHGSGNRAKVVKEISMKEPLEDGTKI